MSSATRVFTSIAANYLPKARVLARSIKRVAPDAHFCLMLVDDAPHHFDLDSEPFDSVLSLSDLGWKIRRAGPSLIQWWSCVPL